MQMLKTLPNKPARHATTGKPDYSKTPNQYVTVHGVTLAYRTIGYQTDAPALVLFQHFTGTMDDWDQALIEELAACRSVLIFENAGIGASQGQTPDSVATMAHYAEGFLDALNLSNIDALGFSLGGAVVQQILADRPELIRKAILVGTGPQGAEGFTNLPNVIAVNAKQSAETGVPLKALLFFTSTPKGRLAGIAESRAEPSAVPAQVAITTAAVRMMTGNSNPEGE